MEVDSKLIEFLLNPDNYPEKPHVVDHYETHISHVFVGDSIAYKVKKPVDFGFLDFTTLEKRRLFCREEVRLNSRLAKDYYLGVTPIYSEDNTYSFSRTAAAKIAEYAVQMRRIPEERLLDYLIGQGRLLHTEMEPVGITLARFHEDVPAYRGRLYGGLGSVIAATEENHEEIKPFVGLTLDQRLYDDLVEYARGFIRQWKGLFELRKKDGLVREGHGDLHSQHVCLTHPPIIFDCIEFNKRFRISDMLEDIAFLLMDLEFRGRWDLSRTLFRAYFSIRRDALVAQLLRFYKVYRAVVRGKIEGLTARSVTDEGARQDAVRRAKEYFSLAGYYIKSGNARFNPIIFMGVSGSGKSAIATGLFPDAFILRSDAVRKELLGLKPDEHKYVEYGTGVYAGDMTEKTYRVLAQRAVEETRSGKRVILDATYLKEAERLALLSACTDANLNPFFIHCCAAEPVLMKRVERRFAEGADVSDAHPSILQEQLKIKEEPSDLPFFRVLRLNTDEDLETIQKALREFLS
jgi:aminoglycoside phosphotransferase family enzyme/predicted kinase